MTQTSEKSRRNSVEDGLICFELRALEQLLRRWNNRRGVEGRVGTWRQRLPALRDAMLVGLSARKSAQAVAPELLQDESWVIESALRSVFDQLGTFNNVVTARERYEGLRTIRQRIGTLEVERPLPFPEKAHYQTRIIKLAQQRGRKEVVPLVMEITAARLGPSKKTIQRARSTPRTRGGVIATRPPEHKLLASVYLDVVSHGGDRALQAQILDSLSDSGYHPIMLYYLIQIAHHVSVQRRLGNPLISVAPPEQAEIQKLCAAVTAEHTSHRPFSSIAPDNR